MHLGTGTSFFIENALHHLASGVIFSRIFSFQMLKLFRLGCLAALTSASQCFRAVHIAIPVDFVASLLIARTARSCPATLHKS